ncbi:hypothetical protein HYPSUDRAFT_188090 [Hypholoma sublateritium FD-334 SS-4]|uniref:DUF6534 domain-containing protein n=1 Tax=Hypholoma sublateritium (strain FD-334 SS-4) TaxID=945553 RepID=A0A0D2MC31_HYPSF|nr:hypothetical protein HYPSUDRAFT_188090 [Hypholoma sublateritium FD-334 SS-4]
MSSPDSTVPGVASVRNFTGSFLLANLFAWGLFGVLVNQVYTYFRAFSKDPIKIKLLVYSIFVLQVTQIVLYTNDIWKAMAVNFGNFTAIEASKTIWLSICIFGSIVACAVQSFYAWRIHVLSDKWYPTVLIMVLSLLALGGSFAVGADIRQVVDLPKLANTAAWVRLGLWQGSTASCDVLIAACMIYYLKRRAPYEEEFTATTHIVNQIIRMTIETGSLTASIEIICLILSFVPRGSGYNMSPLYMLSSVYASTLLVVLNSRIKFTVASASTAWNEGPSTSHVPMDSLTTRPGSTKGNTIGSTRCEVSVEVSHDRPVSGASDEAWNKEQSEIPGSPFHSRSVASSQETV